MTKLLAVLATAALTGCASDADPDDFSDLAGMDDKSDAFSYRMKVVGSLAYGDELLDLAYKNPPRFRAVTFEAQEGDEVSLTLIADSANGRGWVLDRGFRVVRSFGAGDAEDFTISREGTHYIVFRNDDLEDDNFDVYLEGHARTPGFAGAPDGGSVQLAGLTAATLSIDAAVRASLAAATPLQTVARELRPLAYRVTPSQLPALIEDVPRRDRLLAEAAHGGPLAAAPPISALEVSWVGIASLTPVTERMVGYFTLSAAQRTRLRAALTPAIGALGQHESGSFKTYFVHWTSTAGHDDGIVAVEMRTGEIRVIAAHIEP